MKYPTAAKSSAPMMINSITSRFLRIFKPFAASVLSI
jgi:hypothetical protein